MTESEKCLDEMKAKLQSGIRTQHLSHPTSGISNTVTLQYQAIPSGIIFFILNPMWLVEVAISTRLVMYGLV